MSCRWRHAPAAGEIRGRIAPTGTSTNAGATRLPTSPCSALDRTDTGTITRRVRPFVGSSARFEELVQAAGDRREHDVVDRAAQRVLHLADPVERRLGDREPARRPDLGVERAGGRSAHADHVADARHQSDATSARVRWGAPTAWPMASSGCSTMSWTASRTSSCGSGGCSGTHGVLGGGPSPASGAQIEQRRRDQHARDAVGERVVHLQQHGRAVVREPLEDVQLPEGLGRDRADATAPGPPRAPAGIAPPARAAPSGADGSRDRNERRRPTAAGRNRPAREAPADAAGEPGAAALRRRAARRRRSAARPARGSSTDTPATCMCIDGRSR